MLFWHRRAGKDDVSLHWAAVSAMQRVGVYWHLLPEAAQARKAVWDAVNPRTGKRRVDEAFPLAIRETTRENEMFIRFRNGSTWQVIGSDNYDSLVGSPPIGVVLSEWALAKPQAWAYLRPILVENGGWALFITTPRGKNHAHAMWEGARDDPNWHVEILPATRTGVFDEAQLEREKRELIRENGEAIGTAMFNQEYLCSFESPVIGAIYAGEVSIAQMDGRVAKVPWDKALPVHTAWDLGVGDATAIWFCQASGTEIRLIDYYEASGVGLEHYAKVLKDKPYTYGDHWAPHDIEVRDWSANGRTRLQVAASLGVQFRIAPKVSLEDGINAVRMLFHRFWFDERGCERGLLALQHYRRDFSDRLGELKPQPVHDKYSHGADALRYLALSLADRFEIADKIRSDRYAKPAKQRTSAWV